MSSRTKPKRRPAVARKDKTIQIRASSETKALLSRAATLRGQRLSEFMLDSARQKAEDALLDQRVFFLSAADHERFLALLDRSIKPTDEMRRRMQRKPPWGE